MTGNEVRKKFLDYFEKHNHKVVRSSSLVPSDDPTLLFTNAGMVQFKRSFLGEEKRPYNRAATSQKCVRAGGKHNDLENVGYTARHHTFFEMLGNFSFGDYFKQRAIEFAWDLLTNGYGLPEDKLLVSIYIDDDEAYDLWNKNMGLPDERIYRFGEEDNFWAMGDTGPCGPCSEIHLDRGKEFGCGKEDCELGCECDRFLEIWNLVFMQFNRDETGKTEPLPKPSIDTGMGLERLVSILQGVPTNFHTDLILPIIKETEKMAEKPFGETFEGDVAMKVIADHSRAAAFLIGDGVMPSNEGRGYVLRRIMRRAIRYGRNLDLKSPFLHKTARLVFDIMKETYPDLLDSEAFITKVIKNEEIRFTETLDNGLTLLNDTLDDLRSKNQNIVPGDIIFKLYDTYGFPVDIVQDVVRDEKMILDNEGFERCMDVQRSQSRSKAVLENISEAYKSLTSKGVSPEFVGYDKLTSNGNVMVIVKDGQEVKKASSGQSIEIVTDVTPFYGEAGGQTGDKGRIFSDNLEIKITDSIKDPTGLIIHRGDVTSGYVEKGATVTLEVDMEKRNNTACNHTATHILHAVLRQVLGDHIKQAGSLVGPDRLRFDFTHFSQIDNDTLDKIETMVNEKILENIQVNTDEMDSEAAFQSGATALFEEKYGDRVRVVSLDKFSKELCGGTHTNHTGNIGLFKIMGESSIASGVRRMEAITGKAALAKIQQDEKYLLDITRLVKTRPDQAATRIKKILEDNKTAQKAVEQLKAKLAVSTVEDIEKQIRLINNIKVLVKKVSAETPESLRDIADQFEKKLKSGVVILGAKFNNKALIIAKVTKDLTDRVHAGEIVKTLAAEVGGGGGGRPDMAQAGGSKPEKLDGALKKAYEIVG